MMTNLGKTKAEIVLDLVISLNRGNSFSVDRRAEAAFDQYCALVKMGIIVEETANAQSTM